MTKNSNSLTVDAVAEFLKRFAPVDLAEDWDNVGLLVGDSRAEVSRLMTCLTITPATVAEAVEHSADMIVAHHPLPFEPLKRLTRDTTPGRMLLDLIAAGIAVYSPHTAFDSAARGINQRLAEGLGCDCLVVGETGLHTCLEAESSGIALILPGHYASERFAVEFLAQVLAQEFSGADRDTLEIWPSRREREPIRWA